MQHIQTLTDKALYVTDAIPEHGTRLLTLSTCYGGGSDSRLIVVAADDNFCGNIDIVGLP